ncbi:DNA-binding protein [Bradyrhizobium sp. SZCCHNR3058]|uniref:helix-turn-helix transcriptional regulator n=1 Tax=Bradyrhizobium sp. SZCCHNR3058 TaxID=3057423 RepID=UPI0029170F5F|nr:DNA-binding protein [Bradyrhizobium sp. SZCCHNR3058]
MQPKFLLLDRRARQIAGVAIGADPDLLLTTKQMAEWFGVSTQWLEIGRSKNYGPPFRKIGRKTVRYHVGEVKAWLDARSHHSTAEYNKPEVA